MTPSECRDLAESEIEVCSISVYTGLNIQLKGGSEMYLVGRHNAVTPELSEMSVANCVTIPEL